MSEYFNMIACTKESDFLFDDNQLFRGDCNTVYVETSGDKGL
jgi:hypothetical protein